MNMYIEKPTEKMRGKQNEGVLSRKEKSEKLELLSEINIFTRIQRNKIQPAK